ncbi:MAG: type II toxin-antitoxin system prevent-host-death family antitoxin [PVC group bacterium]
MEIAAGQFKARCLKLMDRVAETHETITITKRGKAVARLVPVSPAPEQPLFGYLKGKGTITGDIVAPTGENWEAE